MCKFALLFNLYFPFPVWSSGSRMSNWEKADSDQKFIIFLDFLTDGFYIWLCLDNTSLCIDYHVDCFKIAVFLFGIILPNLKGH